MIKRIYRSEKRGGCHGHKTTCLFCCGGEIPEFFTGSRGVLSLPARHQPSDQNAGTGTGHGAFCAQHQESNAHRKRSTVSGRCESDLGIRRTGKTETCAGSSAAFGSSHMPSGGSNPFVSVGCCQPVSRAISPCKSPADPPGCLCDFRKRLSPGCGHLFFHHGRSAEVPHPGNEENTDGFLVPCHAERPPCLTAARSGFQAVGQGNLSGLLSQSRTILEQTNRRTVYPAWVSSPGDGTV